ncbi:cadherin repeat domain-containing protein, partial [archaeon]
MITDVPISFTEVTLSPMSALARWVINVTDVNEACSFTGGAFSIPENVAAGTSVSSVLRATDPDNNAQERVTYSISSGNTGGLFGLVNTADATAVRLNSTQLVVARAAVNYETQSVYNLDITATDKGGLTCTARVDVTVLNVNDAPVMAAPPALSVAENSAVGTLVGASLTATDEDGDAIAWEIVGGNTGSMFRISTTGQLALNAVPNYETVSAYTLQVRVSDGNGGTSSRNVAVSITDVAEPPVWSGVTTASIAENSAAGASVFTARATDPDAADVLRYAITGGNVRDVFAINSVTGLVTVNNVAELDYETRASVALEVTVTDRVGLSIRQTVTVSILNLNEAPAIVTTSVSIAENSASGTRVQQALEVWDPDMGDSVTLSIVAGNSRVGMSSPLFSITDGYLVARGAVLNFEDVSTREYNLTVEARDSGSPALAVTKVIRVAVTDVNEVPVIANMVRHINENSGIDAAVGAPLIASDPDAGQTLMFSILSGDPLGFFKMDGCSGMLKVNREGLNFEANMTFVLMVRVTDDGGDVPGPARLYADAQVTVIVDDVNEACAVRDEVREVVENSAVGTGVGAPMVSSDPDIYSVNGTWRQVRYSLLSNPRNLFRIDAQSGQLSVARDALNYEDPEGTLLDVWVVASDGPGLTCMSRVRVSVLDVNEAPVVPAQSRSIREATASPYNPLGEGTIIGAAITASDPDAGDTEALAYELVSCTPGVCSTYFSMGASGASAGQLRVAAAGAVAGVLDYELQAQYVVTVRVTDPRGLSTLGNVSVRLEDVNETPMIAAATRSVLENATIGAVIGVPLPASDPEHSTLAFSIVSGNGAGIFDINSLTGQLRIANPAALDFETAQSHALVVQVQDDGMPGSGARLASSAAVTVQVVDCNDPPRISAGSFLIVENSAAGAHVGVVSASDVDAGDVLNYTITSQEATQAGEAAFAIDATTGTLYVATATDGVSAPALDFESKRSYTVMVRVTDAAGASASAAMSISLADVQEAPYFTQSSFGMSVGKNARTGIVIGSVVARDVDAGDVLSFSMLPAPDSNTSGLFDITPAGNVFVSRVGTSFLPLGQPLLMSVRVTDSASMVATAPVWITVVESNDPPIMPDYSRSIAENSAVGANVGAPVVGTDTDAAQVLAYSISSGNVDDTFEINSSTGQVRVARALLDFETRTRYVLSVQCTDNGMGRLSAVGTVTIDVTDVGEAPAMPTTTAMSVDENAVVGTSVGRVTGTDVDIADRTALRYSILTQDTPFTINSVTGDVSVSSAVLDFERSSRYNIVVRATDSYGLTGDGSVVVSVNNRNDAPLLMDGTASVNENALGARIAFMSVQDQDAGQQMKFTLPRPQHVCWSHTVTSANVVSVMPLSLPSTPSVLSLLFRVKGTASSTLVLRVRGSSANERYEVRLGDDAGKLSVRRCGVMCMATMGSTAATLPSMSQAVFTNMWLTFDRTRGTFVLGTRSSNDPVDAVYTTLLNVTDTSSPLAVDELGVSATAAGVRFGSVCFESASMSAGAQVSVEEDTGVLNLAPAAAFNYEAQRLYGVEVRVTDQPGSMELQPAHLSEYAVMWVSVQDMNEAPVWNVSACAGGSYLACVSVPENSAAGTLVATLPLAVDPDVLTSQTLTYRLQLDNNVAFARAIFAVDSVSARVTVAQNVLNFEDTASYELIATVTDSGSPLLSTSVPLLVSVVDVNEAPNIDDQVRSVFENVPVGEAVGEPLVATDPDLPTKAWGQLTFSIVPGGEMNLFSINASTGQVQVANASVDYERQRTYRVRVRVTDGGSLTDEAMVTIQVLNVNEPPVIQDAARNISELALFPTPAGWPIPASDPDENTVLTFSVVGGTGASLFRINRCSGQIELAPGAALDYETRRLYTLNVMVTDDGVPMLSATAVVNVSVWDENEPPVMQDAMRSIIENAPVGMAVGAPIVATDVDTFGGTLPWYTLRYSIISGNDRGIFSINATSGAILVADGAPGVINYEKPADSRFTLLLRVSDAGGLSTTGSVTITATDVNEAPTLQGADIVRSIDENTPRSPRVAGDLVGVRVSA